MVSQAYQLALASGVCALHGPLLRDLTAGQLPVTALMSSDNGKAQVITWGKSAFWWGQKVQEETNYFFFFKTSHC